MIPITPEYLSKLKDLCEKSTTGPWDLIPNDRGSKRLTDCGYGEKRKSIGIIWHGDEQEETNAKFIVEARTALPALIVEIERLKATAEYWENKSKNTTFIRSRK